MNEGEQQPTETPPTEVVRVGVFRRVNEILGFGFGVIDPQIFLYALGTAVCGVGFGMLLDAAIRDTLKPLDWLGWIAIACMASGTIAANLSHSRLKSSALKAGAVNEATTGTTENPISD